MNRETKSILNGVFAYMLVSNCQHEGGQGAKLSAASRCFAQIPNGKKSLCWDLQNWFQSGSNSQIDFLMSCGNGK